MYKVLAGIFMVAFFTTCSKTMCGCDPYVPHQFRATIVNTGIDSCNKPLLLFEDSVAVTRWLGVKRATMIANQLPDSINIQGRTIWAFTAILAPNEEFSCPGSGSAYPHVKILAAY